MISVLFLCRLYIVPEWAQPEELCCILPTLFHLFAVKLPSAPSKTNVQSPFDTPAYNRSMVIRPEQRFGSMSAL